MAQIPPIGPVPSADTCLVGALMYCPSSAAAEVLGLVRNDDVESNAMATVLAALRRLVESDKPHGPQLALSELRRTAELRRFDGVAGELQRAVTSGADPLAVKAYAAAVVSASLRRRIESAGVAFQMAAHEAAEPELAGRVSVLASTIRDCAHRLEQLRGDNQ